ncbi:transcription factor Adf-1-like [Rhagoletis pomonella]|uniref:transcription factor Adf-1-like n=1 Tax=Rhagoletis pomonella TaxID=28610 RepID=UPI001784006C|nr:transcription factor Adf-1-like [Rhagoletis pomonella]
MEDKLIEAVSAHPCLYDKSSNLFRNKFLKEKAWEKVAQLVGVSEKHCQTRWKSLRDRFVRETAALKGRSGAAAEEMPTWSHMEAMSFLKDHVAPRRTFSSLDFSQTDGDTINSNTQDSEVENCEEISSPRASIDASSIKKKNGSEWKTRQMRDLGHYVM